MVNLAELTKHGVKGRFRRLSSLKHILIPGSLALLVLAAIEIVRYNQYDWCVTMEAGAKFGADTRKYLQEHQDQKNETPDDRLDLFRKLGGSNWYDATMAAARAKCRTNYSYDLFLLLS